MRHPESHLYHLLKPKIYRKNNETLQLYNILTLKLVAIIFIKIKINFMANDEDK